MENKILDSIVNKLEQKYIPESAKGNEEAKEILALTQHYRVNNYPALSLIQQERQRQIQKGFTPEHDDKHTDGELAEAASVYAGFATSIIFPIDNIYTKDKEVSKSAAKVENTDAVILVPKIHRWPFDKADFKPTPNDRIKELTKAGALIVAEIDRLLREEGK